MLILSAIAAPFVTSLSARGFCYLRHRPIRTGATVKRSAGRVSRRPAVVVSTETNTEPLSPILFARFLVVRHGLRCA